MTGIRILAVLGSSQAKRDRILERAIWQAVTKRLMTDVPFGVLLSEGLDSSLVAAITADHLAHTKPAKQLQTFCFGLENSPDLKAAKDVAEYLGAAHHEFHFTVQDGINAIKDVIYHIESYDVTTIRASTPIFLMSGKIKSLGMKVVISDEGSDEIFGGYLCLHKAANKEEFHEETCQKIKALHQYDCLRANKATSAWGLEARVPFLDKEFVDVVMSIGPEWKMDILHRQKEKFSDGVSCSWIDGLEAHAAEHKSSSVTVLGGPIAACSPTSSNDDGDHQTGWANNIEEEEDFMFHDDDDLDGREDYEDSHVTSSSVSDSDSDNEMEYKTEDIEVDCGENVVNLGQLLLEKHEHIGSISRSLGLKTIGELDFQVDAVCEQHLQLLGYKSSDKRYISYSKEGFSYTRDSEDLELISNPVEWVDHVRVVNVEFFP